VESGGQRPRIGVAEAISDERRIARAHRRGSQRARREGDDENRRPWR
jgi:hypothetical protein